jgi:heme exporter protein A
MQLIADRLCCIRGGREVFTQLSFSVASGQALAVTGPNGAGKTSLLRALGGLVRLAEGTAELTGGELELTLPEQAHFLGHFDPAKPALTVAENLEFWASFYGGGGAQGIGSALAALGLDGLLDLPAAYLSAGQRRRLSLARLLAVHRPVWLLDEPTATLDAGGQSRFAEIAQAHLAGGGLIVAATHAPLGLEGMQELRLGGRA